MKKIIETHNVGPCSVTAIYEYLPAEPRVKSRVDLPRVSYELAIPSKEMDEHLCNPDLVVLWKPLTEDWGRAYCEPGSEVVRYRNHELMRETLTESLREAKANIWKAVEALRAEYSKRIGSIAKAEAVNPFADDPAPAKRMPEKGQSVVDTRTGKRHSILAVTTSDGEVAAYEVGEYASSHGVDYPISAWGVTHKPVD